MQIRLAHLSDLHFGPDFDLPLWAAVKHEVIRFKPQLLVVTGDIVETPSAIQLLAAKCELREFAREAGSRLIVVAGNHDLYAKGLNSTFSRRRNWFERIFFNENTGAAEAAAEQEFGAPLRFNERYRDGPRRLGGAAARLAYGLRLRPGFEHLLPAHCRQELVVRPDGVSVLVAMLDSNHPGQAIGLATGQVHDQELVALRDALKAIREPYLLRVAVVHHHVLPIAYTGGRIVGAEPLMVLHNAGTVLEILAANRFDLVLHGHKHVPQYARLDLSPRDAAGYSMAVAAAGSAALQAGLDSRANCFNFVTVSENGRITVEAVRYGTAQGPILERSSPNYTVFEEPLATVKKRAYARACERHKLTCRSRTQSFDVTATGDLMMSDDVTGLKTISAEHPRRIGHSVALTKDGWFVDELLKFGEGTDTGVSFELDTHVDVGRRPSTRRFSVQCPRDSMFGVGANYKVSFASGNAVNMTSWECGERQEAQVKQQDWDFAYVGVRVDRPIEQLQLTLKLPTNLTDVDVTLDCSRLATFPTYPIDDAGQAVFSGEEDWVHDPLMTAYETPNIRFDRGSTKWRLSIEHPMVGYRYRLSWRVPGQVPKSGIEGAVKAQRRALLERAQQVTIDPSHWPTPAGDAFNVLYNSLSSLLAPASGHAHHAVELFVYDKQRLALRPVLSRRSWAAPIHPDFEIPLGCGIAGSAFQQCREVPWAQASAQSPFVKPVPSMASGELDIELRSMLAVPVFHPSQVAVKEPPPPWSCIAVVSFSSASEETEVLKMIDESPSDELADLLQGVRGLAHAAVTQILASLHA